MKKIATLISLVLCLGIVSGQVYAQLSKKEKKEWKNKAKEYKRNPAQLKALMEEHNSLKSKVSSLDAQVKNLQSKLEEKDSRISKLNDDNENLKAEVASIKRKLSQKPKQTPHDNFEKGLVFKVQIGAFLNNDITEYAKTQENFGAETDSASIHKYTLGTFRDYWEADKFKKYLRGMGVKDAWIISYQDGTRVPIKDVLEGIIEEKKS